jgi:peptidyl-prolyl cis-trans isomerase SurA
MEYYKKHLEEYNTDFRYQMEEFRDGNILFEIMERNVWGNASSDSAGLVRQYNENKGKYLWAASAGVILFNCSNKKTAEEALAALKAGKDWKKIVVDGNNNIQADSGRYEISQLPLAAGVTAAPGLITEPTVNNMDGTSSFIKVVKLYDANLQRSFEEARGLVINDYQNILEENWVNELKKKYPVKVNETVFQSLLK